MAVGSRLRHIVESQQFSRALLEDLFVLADDMKGQPWSGRAQAEVTLQVSSATLETRSVSGL